MSNKDKLPRFTDDVQYWSDVLQMQDLYRLHKLGATPNNNHTQSELHRRYQEFSDIQRQYAINYGTILQLCVQLSELFDLDPGGKLAEKNRQGRITEQEYMETLLTRLAKKVGRK